MKNIKNFDQYNRMVNEDISGGMMSPEDMLKTAEKGPGDRDPRVEAYGRKVLSTLKNFIVDASEVDYTGKNVTPGTYLGYQIKDFWYGDLWGKEGDIALTFNVSVVQPYGAKHREDFIDDCSISFVVKLKNGYPERLESCYSYYAKNKNGKKEVHALSQEDMNKDLLPKIQNIKFQ